MGLSRRTFTKEFKLAAVRRLEAGVSMAEVSRGLEVSPSVLQRWRHEFRQAPGNAFPGNGQRRWSEGRVAELERKIGQQAVEIDFLKGCLQRIEEQRMLQASTGSPRSTGKIGEEVSAGRRLTIERMVELGRVSRASFYRFSEDAKAGPDPDMDLRDAIQRIALEWPSYGRPRITRELRRRGWTVNPKRVYRLLREDNLLCVRKRKFVVTTNSNHGLRVYPNLAAGMVLTGVDQLWRADITYIRLRDEFVFLAVILDAFSRRVIGWALDRHMEDELTSDGAAHGSPTSQRAAWSGASLRSRQPVCQQRLYGSAEGQRHPDQHEPQGQSVGQRGLRVVHENAEVRGGPAQRVPRPGRGPRLHPRVHREGLQPETPALGARLSAAGRVRGQLIIQNKEAAARQLVA